MQDRQHPVLANLASGEKIQRKEAMLGCRCNDTAISLRAGCELFLRYTTRTSNLETEDFETAKQRIIEVGSDLYLYVLKHLSNLHFLEG